MGASGIDDSFYAPDSFRYFTCLDPSDRGGAVKRSSAENSVPGWDRCDGLIALGLSVRALAVYLGTLAPGLLESDSRELRTLAPTLYLDNVRSHDGHPERKWSHKGF